MPSRGGPVVSWRSLILVRAGTGLVVRLMHGRFGHVLHIAWRAFDCGHHCPKSSNPPAVFLQIRNAYITAMR